MDSAVVIPSSQYPDELCRLYFDICILSVAADRDLQHKLREILTRYIHLKKGATLKTCLVSEDFDINSYEGDRIVQSTAGLSSIRSVFECSSFIFILFTENFRKSAEANLMKDESIILALGPKCKWSLVCVYAEPELKRAAEAFGLRSKKGITLTQLLKGSTLEVFLGVDVARISNNIDLISLKQITVMINSRVDERLQKESEQEDKRAQWHEDECLRIRHMRELEAVQRRAKQQRNRAQFESDRQAAEYTSRFAYPQLPNNAYADFVPLGHNQQSPPQLVININTRAHDSVTSTLESTDVTYQVVDSTDINSSSLPYECQGQGQVPTSTQATRQQVHEHSTPVESVRQPTSPVIIKPMASVKPLVTSVSNTAPAAAAAAVGCSATSVKEVHSPAQPVSNDSDDECSLKRPHALQESHANYNCSLQSRRHDDVEDDEETDLKLPHYSQVSQPYYTHHPELVLSSSVQEKLRTASESVLPTAAAASDETELLDSLSNVSQLNVEATELVSRKVSFLTDSGIGQSGSSLSSCQQLSTIRVDSRQGEEGLVIDRSLQREGHVIDRFHQDGEELMTDRSPQSEELMIDRSLQGEGLVTDRSPEREELVTDRYMIDRLPQVQDNQQVSLQSFLSQSNEASLVSQEEWARQFACDARLSIQHSVDNADISLQTIACENETHSSVTLTNGIHSMDSSRSSNKLSRKSSSSSRASLKDKKCSIS